MTTTTPPDDDQRQHGLIPDLEGLRDKLKRGKRKLNPDSIDPSRTVESVRESLEKLV